MLGGQYSEINLKTNSRTCNNTCALVIRAFTWAKIVNYANLETRLMVKLWLTKKSQPTFNIIFNYSSINDDITIYPGQYDSSNIKI